MRCTFMSHRANIYLESGLIFGGNPAKDKPHGPPLYIMVPRVPPNSSAPISQLNVGKANTQD
jgi:hypothetical protein